MFIQIPLLISEFQKKFYVSNKNAQEGPKKCPIYLKLPWIDENFLKLNRKIKLAITNCFGAVQPRVVFCTRRVLPGIHKNVLLTFQQSNVVYEYVCH